MKTSRIHKDYEVCIELRSLLAKNYIHHVLDLIGSTRHYTFDPLSESINPITRCESGRKLLIQTHSYIDNVNTLL